LLDARRACRRRRGPARRPWQTHGFWRRPRVARLRKLLHLRRRGQGKGMRRKACRPDAMGQRGRLVPCGWDLTCTLREGPVAGSCTPVSISRLAPSLHKHRTRKDGAPHQAIDLAPLRRPEATTRSGGAHSDIRVFSLARSRYVIV